MRQADTPVLRTERLRLDPLRVTDAEQIVTVLADHSLYQFTDGVPPTRAALDERYAAQVTGSALPGEAWHNWIVRLPGGDAIGFVQATVVGDSAVVAWLIGVPSQRVGHATESARAMCAWLTTNGVTRLRAHVHADHVASQGVAAAIGFHPSGDRDDDGEDIWIRDA